MKIDDPKTLRFPCFDGNGMWLSMGNIADHGKVGLLFINAVTPHRVRIHGVAKLVRDPAVLSRWKDVGLAVEVTIQSAWINCPRYIHPMEKRGQSEHVPGNDRETAPADWKALEVVADVLPPQPHEVKKVSVASAMLSDLVEAAGIEPASASIQPSARHMLSRVIAHTRLTTPTPTDRLERSEDAIPIKF